MNKTSKRIITGTAGALLMAGAVWWNQWSFFILFGVISSFMLHELYGIFRSKGDALFYKAGLLAHLFLYTAFFFCAADYAGPVVLPAGVVLVFLIFAGFLFSRRTYTVQGAAFTVFGWVYITLPFSLLHYIAFSKIFLYQGHLILGLLLLQWATDTGAYLIGKTFGRTKLWERISPQKTREGYAGGIVFSILTAMLLSRLLPENSAQDWIVLGGITGIISPFGDLFESMIKREYVVKDSGNFLPGHGGFLDRFDGFVFTIPFAAIYILFFR